MSPTGIGFVLAVALALASEVERGFSPASKSPSRSDHRIAVGRSKAQRKNRLLARSEGPSPTILTTNHKNLVKPHFDVSSTKQMKYKVPINYLQLAML